MFRQQNTIPTAKSYTCPDCGSTRFSIIGNKLSCTNCPFTIKTSNGNKYRAKRQIALDGIQRDSKFEATNADELRLRKIAKDILDYDSQFKVEIWIYRANGLKAFKVSHKVDFRIHHKDGSYELLEAKGVETDDYKWRRKCLEELWLPEHKDHTYTVVKDKNNWRKR